MAEPPLTIRQALDLAPKEAIEAFRRRDELRVSVSWRDLEPEEHARAFTVAKIAKLDLLADIGGSLNKALAEGQTYEQWKAAILPTLQKAGWWGRVQDAELTGTDQAVFVGDRRLQTIFRTNMRVSYAAGQWERIQQAKARWPYLRYSAVMDDRTRPDHAAWNGIILHADHPFWRTHFPPNGWNCRCGVNFYSERDLERKGWRVTTDAELQRLAPTDPVSQMSFGPPGQRLLRPKTPRIDHGWDYNVGAESLHGLVEKAAASIQRARAAGLAQAAEDLLAEMATVLSDDLMMVLLRLLDAAEPASGQWEGGEVAAGRKKRRRAHAGSIGDSYPNGGRRGQSRDRAGRFADEGAARGPTVRAERRLAHTRQWVEDTMRKDVAHLGNLEIGGLSPRSAALLRDAGLPVKGRSIALSPSHTIHILNKHGGEGERLRGQIPITAEDLHLAPVLINKAGLFKESTRFPGRHVHSAPRATTYVVHREYAYELLIEQVNAGTVLRGMWKWLA